MINYNVKELTMDVQANGKHNIEITQYDKAALKIKVLDGGRVLDLTAFTSVQFTHLLPDGQAITHEGEINEEHLLYLYAGSEMDQLGIVRASFALIDSNGDKLSSRIFNVHVMPDLRMMHTVPSSVRKDIIAQLAKDIEDIKNENIIISEPGKNGKDGVNGIDGKDAEIPNYLISNAMLRTKESSFAFVNETGVKPTAYFTISDDDGDKAVWSKLRTISEEKGVPFVMALFGTSPLPDEQGLYLQNELGWEITSHSYMHEALPTFTGQALDDELALSKRHLTDKGYNVTNIIYPFGQINDEGRNIAAKYFNCGAIVGAARTSSGSTDVTRAGLNMQPVAPFDLGRVAFGAFTEGNNTLEYYKTMVDNAVRDGSWLIFMLHCGHPDHDETQQQHLRDIIDYIHSLKAKIVTIEEGNQIFGNKLYVSKKTDTNNAENLIAVTNDGKLFLENGEFKATAMIRLAHNAFSVSEPLMSYPDNMVSSFSVSHANAAGFPNDSGGIVTTSRIGSDVGGAFNCQEYTQILTNKTFKRFWNIGLNEWNEFEEFAMVAGDTGGGGGYSVTVIAEMNTYKAASPITAYPNNKITVSAVNFAGAIGFPGDRPGTATTYRIGGNGWDYQEYKEYGNHNKYIRYIDTDGFWSDFEQLNMI